MFSENSKSSNRAPIPAACFALLALAWLSTSGGLGCAAAPVSAAVGSGSGAVAYTDRGAKGDVQASVGDVDDRARDTFKEMGIALTDSAMRDSGNEQDLNGKYGGTDVSIQMIKSAPSITHVEVMARESTLNWNKDYAKEILNKIASQS